MTSGVIPLKNISDLTHLSNYVKEYREYMVQSNEAASSALRSVSTELVRL